MSAPMSREAVDETLAGLGAAHDRIAAAMFAIDSHPGLAFLRGGGLGGRTESRWAALRPEVDLLWAHFAVLGELLERARSIRGQRRPEDSDWDALRLICGEPVVGLDAAGMPTILNILQRDLHPAAQRRQLARRRPRGSRIGRRRRFEQTIAAVECRHRFGNARQTGRRSGPRSRGIGLRPDRSDESPRYSSRVSGGPADTLLHSSI